MANKSQKVLDRIANSATDAEKKALVNWADMLLTIKSSDVSVITKVKESISATAKFDTIKPIITVIGKELTPRELSGLSENLGLIYGSNSSALSKTKQATSVTAQALKDLAWDNRGLPGRLGIATAVVTALTLGSQGAGIAALGTAIGVPLWVLFGAGAAFLGDIYERFTGKKHRIETTHTVIDSHRRRDNQSASE